MFAALVQYDYEAYPLAYMFLERRSDPGDRKKAISKFLLAIKGLDINPSTFLSDKDEGQITGISVNFPSSSIQLCFWHTLQAINRRMKAAFDSDEEYRRYHRNPPLFPWVSEDFPPPMECLPSINPNAPINRGTRDELLDLVRIQFNRHPLIPNDKTHYFLAKDEIHSLCAAEDYEFCRSKIFGSLWVYLWLHWYNESSWSLWSLSSDINRVPLARTTMFVESHWKRLKHDHLRKRNRAVSCFFI